MGPDAVTIGFQLLIYGLRPCISNGIIQGLSIRMKEDFPY